MDPQIVAALAEARELLGNPEAQFNLRLAPRAEELCGILSKEGGISAEVDQVAAQLASVIEEYAAEAVNRLMARAQQGDLLALDVVAKVAHADGDPEVLQAYLLEAHNMTTTIGVEHISNVAVVLTTHYHLGATDYERAYWLHVFERVAQGQTWAVDALVEQGARGEEWQSQPDLLGMAFGALATWVSKQSSLRRSRK